MEINGKRVSAFDEFLERFVTAQEEARRLKKHRNLHVFLFRVSCVVVFLVFWFGFLI